MLWLGSYGGVVNRFDPKTGQFTRYNNVSKGKGSTRWMITSIMALCDDGQGGIWVATLDNGLNRLDKTTGQFTIYRTQAGKPKSLSGNLVLSAYLDRAGILWAGTYGQGLNKLDLLNGRFTQYQNQAGNPNSLSSNLIWGRARRSLRFFVGRNSR